MSDTRSNGDVECPRCRGSGIDPVTDDPTNHCGNIWIGNRDSGKPVCRMCGTYGTIPASLPEGSDANPA